MARRAGIAPAIEAIKISAKGTASVNGSNGSTPIETHQGSRQHRGAGEPGDRRGARRFVSSSAPRYAN